VAKDKQVSLLSAQPPPQENDSLFKGKSSFNAKSLSCVAFSPSGSLIAAGEQGHQPRIMVWDHGQKLLLQSLYGHKFGVLSVCFSPNDELLASAGFHHDGYIYLWNWRTGQRLAGIKVASKLNGISFASETCILSIGLKHAKFWYFDDVKVITSNLVTTFQDSRGDIHDIGRKASNNG
jgi:WD40 repeat protein